MQKDISLKLWGYLVDAGWCATDDNIGCITILGKKNKKNKHTVEKYTKFNVLYVNFH